MDNPADPASRGVNPVSLMSSALWRNGPPWILGQEGANQIEEVSEMTQPPPECIKGNEGASRTRYRRISQKNLIIIIILLFITRKLTYEYDQMRVTY